jgi:hypothetical protein
MDGRGGLVEVKAVLWIAYSYLTSCHFLQVEILVVDREMKPKYLLESCPHLKRLSLEWQHDLSQPPYHQYHPEWFARMLLTPEWTELNLKLTHLVSHMSLLGRLYL